MLASRRWPPGTPLQAVKTADGLTLRPASPASRPTLDEALDRMHAQMPRQPQITRDEN